MLILNYSQLEFQAFGGAVALKSFGVKSTESNYLIFIVHLSGDA